MKPSLGLKYKKILSARGEKNHYMLFQKYVLYNEEMGKAGDLYDCFYKKM